MTVTDIITQVKNNVDRTDLTDAKIYTWLNNRQRTIQQIENAYFMNKTVTTPTIAAQRSYVVPLDYKDELIISLLDGNQRTILPKWRSTEPERNVSVNDRQGKPNNYWIWEEAYFLEPIPDKVYTLELRYYSYLADLSATNLTNEFTKIFPDLLIAGATADCFTYLFEPTQAAIWEQKFSTFLLGDRVTFGYLPQIRKRALSNYNPRMRLQFK